MLPNIVATQYYDVLNSLSLRENDIVICIDESAKDMQKYNLTDDVDIDLTKAYNMRSDDPEWFLDIPIHTTPTANKAIADWIFENYLKIEIDKKDFSKKQEWWQKSSHELPENEILELEKYLKDIEPFDCGNNEKIGAIVMNCNPFTLGHKYLIDYARKSVDFLYIFVVEENRSVFQFEDRINLVRQGVKEWDNIKVVPSGKFILSYSTMPIYFEKEQKKEAVIDATADIEIFAKYIAPKLNISVRFAGTEPIDKVTLQYNMEMRRTLSEYDIEFIEIPRVELSGNVISASIVRKKIKDNKWDEVEKLVPKSTYEFLVYFFMQ